MTTGKYLPNSKMAKNQIDIFPKMIYIWPKCPWKKISTSLTHRKMPISTIVKYHFTLLRWLILRKKKTKLKNNIIIVGEEFREIGILCTVGMKA